MNPVHSVWGNLAISAISAACVYQAIKEQTSPWFAAIMLGFSLLNAWFIWMEKENNNGSSS